MIKVKRFFHLPKWLKQRPEVTYIVCPRCQRQADDIVYSQVKPPTEEYAPDQGRLMVAQQAMDAAADLDVRRRQRAAGDPLKDQLLSEIEVGFIQNVADLGRKLRRSGEQDEQP